MNDLLQIDSLCIEGSFNQQGYLYMYIVGGWSNELLSKSQVEMLRDHLNKVLEKFDEKEVGGE